MFINTLKPSLLLQCPHQILTRNTFYNYKKCILYNINFLRLTGKLTLKSLTFISTVIFTRQKKYRRGTYSCFFGSMTEWMFKDVLQLKEENESSKFLKQYTCFICVFRITRERRINVQSMARRSEGTDNIKVTYISSRKPRVIFYTKNFANQPNFYRWNWKTHHFRTLI